MRSMGQGGTCASWTRAWLLSECEQYCATPVTKSGNRAGEAFKLKETPKVAGWSSHAYPGCEGARASSTSRSTVRSFRQPVSASPIVLMCWACCGSRSLQMHARSDSSSAQPSPERPVAGQSPGNGLQRPVVPQGCITSSISSPCAVRSPRRAPQQHRVNAGARCHRHHYRRCMARRCQTAAALRRRPGRAVRRAGTGRRRGSPPPSGRRRVAGRLPARLAG